MEKETFVTNFQAAATAALDFARMYVLEPLPDAKRFRIRLNQSYDKNLPSSFAKVYPEDGTFERARELRHCTEQEVVDVLWRAGSVPAWVNVSVIAQTDTETVLELVCAGRFIPYERFLHRRQPVFQVCGPAGSTPGHRVSIWHSLELWTVDELIQTQPHLEKIWQLNLLGNEFDDSILSSLPVIPNMKILHLRHSPSHGDGLSSQSRHPKLRGMSVVGLAHPEAFRLRHVPTFPMLESLSIQGLPSRSCGLEELICNLPRLESLTLESEGNVVLDAPISGASCYLGITASNVLGECRLPREVERLSLHLSESTVLDLGRLLRGVEKVKSLHLRGTPVDDRFAEEVVSRFALEYIDLVETQVTADCLRRLAKAHPSLRMHPNVPGDVATDARRPSKQE